jgi:hypothetical protein
MTTAGVAGHQGQPDDRGRVISWLSSWFAKVFERNPQALNWARGAAVLDVVLVPMIVCWAIGDEQYLLSAVFAVLFGAVGDPGGAYGHRALHLAAYGAVGALVTALAYAIGGVGWGWLVLAAFVVTLAAGLAIRFGVHTFVEAALLNVWFIVAIGVAVGLHHQTNITSHTWAQVVAWVGGSALWIALAFLGWLLRGRNDRPQPIEEVPGDTSPRKLTPPLIMFALLRGLGVAAAVALAFGLNLSHGAWLPVATIVAIKPALDQTTLIAAQRVAGALIGAVAASLLLLLPAAEHGLKLFAVDLGFQLVAIVLLMHAVAIRFYNYAIYTAAIAAAVLIMLDVLQPTNYSAEGYRVLWTLAGVGIGVLVMLVGSLLAKRTAKAPPQAASQPA